VKTVGKLLNLISIATPIILQQEMIVGFSSVEQAYVIVLRDLLPQPISVHVISHHPAAERLHVIISLSHDHGYPAVPVFLKDFG